MFQAKFLRKTTFLFAACFIPCVFLIPGEFYTSVIEGRTRMRLERDLTYEGVASINTRFVAKMWQGINFSTCVGNCLSLSSECAAILYSKNLLNCTLLKCHLNDRLTKDSTRGDDWEYWRNSHGNLCL
jgi:hypothetical protein